ncbi:class I tRNA ligase family protein [Candidatus Mycoplasma pogonae]
MIKIYVCGPTVYNSPHIGNLRPVMFFDILIRAYRSLNHQVKFVHNITDIDDKIIDAAIENFVSEESIAKKYLNEYLNLLQAFNIQKPDFIEKVTDNLNSIVDYINQLIFKDIAYKSEVTNDIFLNISKIKNYGNVSDQKLEKLIVKDDKKINSKKNFHDFVLWKDTDRGIKYQVKLGLGRPGWHTECAAIINKHFGANGVDFHGGGIDLKFPHHENENAQHFGLYQQNISKKWLWTGTININNEKMSKSLGNVLLAKDFLKNYNSDLFRLIIFTSGITSEINLDANLIQANQNKLNDFIKIFNQQLLANPDYKIELPNNLEVEQIFNDIINLRWAEANRKLNEIAKISRKNLEAANILFGILQKLGFIFVNQRLEKNDYELFYQWKNLVNNKDFAKADELREILKFKKIL